MLTLSSPLQPVRIYPDVSVHRSQRKCLGNRPNKSFVSVIKISNHFSILFSLLFISGAIGSKGAVTNCIRPAVISGGLGCGGACRVLGSKTRAPSTLPLKYCTRLRGRLSDTRRKSAFISSPSIFTSKPRRSNHLIRSVNRNSNSNRALTPLLRMTSTTTSSNDIASSKPPASTETTERPKPPIAPREENRVVLAGVLPPDAPDKDRQLVRQAENSVNPLLDPPVAVPDPYGWLRDETHTDEQVLQHLKDENAHAEGMTSHLQTLRTALYDEFLRGIQETDYTVPSPDGSWMYYTRTFEGQSYRVYCRAPKPDNVQQYKVKRDGSKDTPILPGEQVYLDVNQLAEGQSYCSVGHVKSSPSQDLVAYTVDYTGGETCQLFVKNKVTGEIIDHDPKLECDGSVVWGNDDKTLFYIKMDKAHRPYQVYKRVIGNSGKEEQVEDELLFEEKDELYWVRIYKSFDEKYFFISTKSKETSEIHYLDLTKPNDDNSNQLQCIAKRRSKVLYSVKHHEGQWIIITNVDGTPNMRLMTCPVGPNCQDQWRDMTDQNGQKMFDGGYDRSLDGITAFKTHGVAAGREGGIPRIWFMRFKNNNENDKTNTDQGRGDVTGFQQLTFDETAYDVGFGTNYEYDADSVVLSYDSLITPLQSIRVSLSDPSLRTVLKEKNVPGYKKKLYGCERLTVPSRDGETEIPVSIVYRKDVIEQHLSDSKPLPTHLYGYGSYGACMEASFRSTRLPLLDRGVVYVIAHVRGGGEMGRQWYEEPNGAKYLCKKNTFYDFVDVAKWLVNDRKLTIPDLLSCEGRSAGGLLIGASINQAPELFKVALLGVPFVDVVCTMIDASIPLTVVEWEEWGNPNEEKYLQYMMEYSPVNNVKKGAKYPACLLTGGLHDPRVQYWEPAKFAAELRHNQSPESGPVLCKIDMSAGHFSASDRYKYLKELAFDFAFLLDRLGLVDASDEVNGIQN